MYSTDTPILLLMLFAPLVAATCGHAHGHSNGSASSLLLYYLPVLSSESTLALCVFLLAITPLFVAVLVPSNLPRAFERLMISFAVGSLLGDVFLHTLPHTLTQQAEHAHHHHHQSNTIQSPHEQGCTQGQITPAIKVAAGFVGFLLFERFMALLTGGHQHHHHEHQHHCAQDSTGKHTRPYTQVADNQVQQAPLRRTD